MLKLLYPKKYYNSIFDIDLDALKQKGIAGIIVDLDNTLIPWGEDKTTERLHQWLEKMTAMGFRLCIASNSGFNRAVSVAKKFQLPLIARAWKPKQKPFKKGMSILGTPPQKTAVIGDQIFTDMLGGNRMGLYTILVVPISQKELWTTKLVRQLEKVILKRIGNRD
jgi:HAD superfamily phosphatase (TIGR01668 family)